MIKNLIWCRQLTFIEKVLYMCVFIDMVFTFTCCEISGCRDAVVLMFEKVKFIL